MRAKIRRENMNSDVEHAVVTALLAESLKQVRLAISIDSTMADFDMEGRLVDALAQLDRQLKPSEVERLGKERKRDKFYVEWEETCDSIIDAARSLRASPKLKFLSLLREVDFKIWREITDKVIG